MTDGPEPSFRQRILAGEVLFGAFLNLGCALSAEIVSLAGFDWVAIDLEHGAGGEEEALYQIHAMSGTRAVPLVRVESLSRPRIHRVLDIGAVGVLVPQLETAEEAKLAAAYSRYSGLRGVARGNRARRWSRSAPDDLQRADAEVVCGIQIETESGLREASAIAAIEGVDLLFIGPGDLAHSLEIEGGANHPALLDAARTVAAAAREFGKAAGVFVETVEQAGTYRALGFTVIGCSSDGRLLARETRKLAGDLRALAGLAGAGVPVSSQATE